MNLQYHHQADYYLSVILASPLTTVLAVNRVFRLMLLAAQGFINPI
jgi:hypothetical protein